MIEQVSKDKKKKTSFADLKKTLKANDYYNYPNNYKQEGEDHINISIYSKSQIGKIFSPEYNKIISYPYIGKFNSVLSLWFWVRSSSFDDNLRRLTGPKLKAYVKVNKEHGNFVTNFKAIIGHATWIKVKSYPNIIKAIKELPPETKLLSYSIVQSSELRITTNYANVIIDIANEIVSAVKQDREPNFESFVDNKEKAGLMYLEDILSKNLSPEKIEEMKQNLAKELETVSKESSEPVDAGSEAVDTGNIFTGDIPESTEGSNKEDLAPAEA